MSEVVKAVLQNEDPERIAKIRLEVMASHDLWSYARGLPGEELERVRRARLKVVYDLLDTLRRFRALNVFYVAKLLMRCDWSEGIGFLNTVLNALESVRSSEFLQSVASDRAQRAESTAVKRISYTYAIYTPIAWSMLAALRSRTAQSIISVSGSTGVGKTTLIYNSFKAVMLYLGLPTRQLKELFYAMYIQRVEEFVELLKLASKTETKIPVVVFDDVALTAHAYDWWAAPSRRKWLMELAKVLTISREMIGCFVVSSPGKVFAGLRGLSHLTVEARSKQELVDGDSSIRVVTFWSAWVPGPRNAVDATGTLIPPLAVDDDVYSNITAVKVMLWKEAVKSLGEGGGG